MVADDLVERELMLSRFRRLIAELLTGRVTRTLFEAWEVEILVDIEACAIDPKRRERELRRYERATIRQLENGPGPPMKYSEYVQRRSTRRPSSE